MNDDKCPKCGAQLSRFYLKQTCPKCGVNLMYYKMDERLEKDAENARREVAGLWRLARKIDKAHLIEKHYKKKNQPFPWDET
ncbi:MAG: hypothetical protein LIO43_03590 [Clostridiales bacterium]|nr:hypothetical protein [Clostridiales bacterium]